MKRVKVASLGPGRAGGKIETNPAGSGPETILLIGQEGLGAVSVPPAGLVIADAAPFSHPVIRWLGRGTPIALLGSEEAARWAPGEAVVLDTVRGELRAREGDERVADWHAPPLPAPGLPVRMADGTEIWLLASVGDAPGAGRAVEWGASGIGLVRSEYLLPADGGEPSADFYRRAFADLLTAAGSLDVTVRLLDLAPDKWPGWLTAGAPPEALRGLHGSRLYAHPAVWRAVDAQVAALRALTPGGRLAAIWPSGGTLEAFRRRREEMPTDLALGAMVETPIEALALDRWLEAADFVAIGCNDLLQHLCGADRDDPRQRELLDPYRPEPFRLLREAADRAGAQLGRVQLCGLLAQVEGVLPVLIGLGYRRFSCEPSLIPWLALGLAERTSSGSEALAAEVCAAREARAVREALGVPVEGQWGLARDRAGRHAPLGP